MGGYGLVLFVQALLALLALGACGGWALVPFRRDERPYLWMAAPLAGLLTFGGAVAALYLVAAWPLGRCLWAGLALNAAVTAAALARARPARPSRGQLAAGAAVALAAAAWATFICDRTAAACGEPTLVHVSNNDMFNYALVGDWQRVHRVTDRPDPRVETDFLPRYFLNDEGSRPVAFALVAAAAEARGTSSLFSFDWLTGVVLAAALMAFAGLFASGPLLLALLAAGAAVSSWPTECRSAFLGKSLAYPGALLLSALALDALARGGRARVAACVALGWALAYALNPVFPPAALGLVLGGYAALEAGAFAVGWWRGTRPPGAWAGAARAVLAALLLWAVMTLPPLALHRWLYEFVSPPLPPAAWSVVVPVSLDLDVPVVSMVLGGTRKWTVWGAVALVALASAAAVRQRDRAALALLGCALAVPAARLAGDHRLYMFQGVLYPMTLAGTALLAGARPSARRLAAVAALVALSAGLRLPQHLAAGRWYFYPADGLPTVLRRSEVEAVRAAVGTDAVDVALVHYPDNHCAMTELLARGPRVQLRGPAWARTLGVYPAACPHEPAAPKARFSLIEREQWAPPGAARWVGSRWKLVEDRDAVAVFGMDRPMQCIRFEPPLWGVWLGAEPAELLLHNGTGRPANVRLRATLVQYDARVGAPDVLRWRIGTASGSLAARHEGAAELPLQLQPGLNRLALWADPAGGAPPAGGLPRVAFAGWHIEPGTPAPPKE